MKKKIYNVEVTETFKGRIWVEAFSEEEAENEADELVGGGLMNSVNSVYKYTYTEDTKTREGLDQGQS